MLAIEELPEIMAPVVLVCSRPWRENPYRLVTLLEFVKVFQAHELLGSVRLLASTAVLCFEADLSGYRLAQVANFAKELNHCQELCAGLDLQMSALHAKQIKDQIDQYGVGIDNKITERMAAMLSVTIENELSLRSFLAVSPDKANLYVDVIDPFGPSVAAAFPSVSYDASEANRCYALGRNTASVFHLMRVLEIGLGALAKQFNKPYDHTNWETILNQIEKAIGEIERSPNKPANWRDEREFWSQCASHFRVVKDAWRNYTAHARGKYDEQEALDMLGNVRGFMQKLATRLHE